jgi:hypothetical protein
MWQLLAAKQEAVERCGRIDTEASANADNFKPRFRPKSQVSGIFV